MRCNAPWRLITGPLGSGKSTGSVFEILMRAQGQEVGRSGKRRTRGVVVRDTYRELCDTTKVTMDEWLPPEIYQWSESDMTYWIKYNDIECEVMLRALDNPDDVKKLMSMDLTFAWINEARFAPKAVLDTLKGRVGRFPSAKEGRVTWSGVWMDTNPPDSDHWLYKTFEEYEKIDEIDRPDYRVFHQPSGLSPEAENVENLLNGQRTADGRPLYYARLMSGQTQAWIDAFVHGKYSFIAEGRPVYPEYHDDIHTAKSPLEWRKGVIKLGMDFGLTPALVLGQRLEGLGQWQWFDEVTSQDMGAQRFARHAAQYIKSKYPGARLEGYGDPAGNRRGDADEVTAFQVVQALGLPIVPAPTNDPDRRRDAVATPLSALCLNGQPALIVSPSCKMLRKGMAGGYHHARVKITGSEMFKDEPVKNIYSHVCEAGQYMLVGEGTDYDGLDGVKPAESGTDRRVKVPKMLTACSRSEQGQRR